MATSTRASRTTGALSTDVTAPVRIAAKVVAVVFLAIGILGFIPGVTSNFDAFEVARHESHAELLGLFQVSALHNAVHLLFGVAGLIMAAGASRARTFLIGAGSIYLALTAYGLVIDHDSAANFVPVNAADNLLHLALGAGMVALGAFLGRGVRTSR